MVKSRTTTLKFQYVLIIKDSIIQSGTLLVNENEFTTFEDEHVINYEDFVSFSFNSESLYDSIHPFWYGKYRYSQESLFKYKYYNIQVVYNKKRHTVISEIYFPPDYNGWDHSNLPKIIRLRKERKRQMLLVKQKHLKLFSNCIIEKS
jgi:hypothetical protein